MEDFLPEGRLLSDSKSGYAIKHPKNVVAFNANICTRSKGRIWNGDLDVTADEAKLKTLATTLGEELYVLRESAVRDSSGNLMADPDLSLAIAVVSPARISLFGIFP